MPNADRYGLNEPVRLTTDDGGFFFGTITEANDNSVVVTPNDPAVLAVFPKGYRLGAAHWAAQLTHVDILVSGPEAFNLVYVDDDQTAAEIGVLIEQPGGAALTLYGAFQTWCPEGMPVEDAVMWAKGEISRRTDVPLDDIVAERATDRRHGARRIVFSEVVNDND